MTATGHQLALFAAKLEALVAVNDRLVRDNAELRRLLQERDAELVRTLTGWLLTKEQLFLAEQDAAEVERLRARVPVRFRGEDTVRAG